MLFTCQRSSEALTKAKGRKSRWTWPILCSRDLRPFSLADLH